MHTEKKEKGRDWKPSFNLRRGLTEKLWCLIAARGASFHAEEELVEGKGGID